MYHIGKGKGHKTNIYWMPTVCLEPHTHYLISFTKYTYEAGITASIWDTRNLKPENYMNVSKILSQNSNAEVLLCSFPSSMSLGCKTPDMICGLWVWHLGVWEVPGSKLTPTSTHYMAPGKSLNLGSISFPLNWGMIFGHLPRLWNKMIKCM